MRNYLSLFLMVAFGAVIFLLLPGGITHADCSPDDGDANPNNIVCDNSPAGPFIPDDGVVQGAGGDDTITIEGNTTINGNIEGDGDGSGGRILNGGNDVITNNGSVGEIRGDNVFSTGGNDTITNNGTAADILGDSAAGTGGNDEITNNGSAGDIFGDSNGNSQSGDDTITNNGTAGTLTGDGSNGFDGDDVIINNGVASNIRGDNSAIGGDDTISNNGTVTGGINAEEGDDDVTILVTSTVGGNINGGTETTADALTFNGATSDAAGWAALDALANTCEPNCAGTVTFCTQSFTFTNFEGLTNAVTLVGGNCGVIEVSFSNGSSGESTSALDEICAGTVKVFRLPNGDLEVYSGFDILVPNGFLVAKISHDQQQVGNVFSNASAPAEGQGWTATLEMIDGLQKIVVRDAAGNIVNQDCQW